MIIFVNKNMDKLIIYIRYKDEKRKYFEVLREHISESSQTLIDAYFNEIDNMFADETRLVLDTVKEIQNKENILHDNVLYKEMKMLNWKFPYELDRLRYHLKMNETSTLKDFYEHIENMIIDDILRFT